VRWSVTFPASLSTNLCHRIIRNFTISLHKNSVSQSVPQNYIFPFLTNLCHIKWAVTFPSHFLWILPHIKLSNIFLPPTFHSSVCCTALSLYCHVSSSYVIVPLCSLTFQNSVSYEIVLYLNSTIVSFRRHSNLYDHFLSLYKHVNLPLSLPFILEPDNFHYWSVKNISGYRTRTLLHIFCLCFF